VSGSWLDPVIIALGPKADGSKTETIKSYQGTLNITPTPNDVKITVLCNLSAFNVWKVHHTK
jgi:hypothetical protein